MMKYCNSCELFSFLQGLDDEVAALKAVYNTPMKKTKKRWRWLKKRCNKVEIDPSQVPCVPLNDSDAHFVKTEHEIEYEIRML